MLKNEFETIMTRLKNVYGEQKYPQDRLEYIFDAVEPLDAETFLMAIKRLLANEAHAPLLSRIVQEVREDLEKARQKEMDRIQKENPCSFCRSEGYVVYKGAYGKADSVSACKCKLGAFWPAYPRFKNELIGSIVR